MEDKERKQKKRRKEWANIRKSLESVQASVLVKHKVAARQLLADPPKR